MEVVRMVVVRMVVVRVVVVRMVVVRMVVVRMVVRMGVMARMTAAVMLGEMEVEHEVVMVGTPPHLCEVKDDMLWVV